MTCESANDVLILSGIEHFLSGAVIEEIKELWGFGRNKTIRILKSQLGEEKYAEIAKRNGMARANAASVLVNKGSKRGPCSQERREKISKANKGKVRTPEHRKKVSEGLKKRIEEKGPSRTKESYRIGAQKAKETKLKNGAYERFSKKITGVRKKPLSPEVREIMRQKKLLFYHNGGENWIKGKHHSDETRLKCAKATAERWKLGKYSNLTGLWRSGLEMQVLDSLSKRYDCEHSFRISNRVYDIFIQELNLLIEINGDYWHFNPSFYKADHFDKHRNLFARDVWERDKRKIELAVSSGYNITTIWQSDLLQNFEEAIDNAISKFSRGDRQSEENSSN